MENMSWPGLCSLLGECRLDALGVLKMSHEHWTYLDQQRLELRVLRVRDQHLVERIEH